MSQARRQAVLFEKDRKRRTIFYDDAYQQRRSDLRSDKGRHWYNVTDDQSFLDARTTPTFDTYVDTYVWCVGNGTEPPWGPFGEKYRGPIWPVLGSSQRATDLIVDACHARGMEVWGSLRMNDLHDAARADRLEDTNDPLKAEHPEYLLGKLEDRKLGNEAIERLLWTAFNFEYPEVRQHRLDFIERNAGAHDFDGYELDFTRFLWYLPQGRERELAPLMTDFVREVRSRLNAVADRRGRPYTLAVHVLDSAETSLNLGLEVEAWVSEGLVDVLVVGLGNMPYTIPLDRWQALGSLYGVPVYPSLDPRSLFMGYKERLKRDSAWHEYTRGAATWWWHNGADGVYVYNLFTGEDVWGLEKEPVYAPLKEIGDPAALVGKDKLYGIDHANAGVFSQGAETAPLPLALDVFERRLPLHMGPDADDPRARFTVHAWTSDGSADTKVWMRLNHALLETFWQDGHYEAEVPSGIMRVGCNDLAMRCDAELVKTASPIIVHEVLTSVAY
jgi:hypothetical protein